MRLIAGIALGFVLGAYVAEHQPTVTKAFWGAVSVRTGIK